MNCSRAIFGVAILAGAPLCNAEIAVVQGPAPREATFRNHVQPVLARFGCSSGSCHGALAGKGGFKLSLRGYDDHRDYLVITRQARGRRIELADPGRSLILAKPTGALPHKGGVRFDIDSDAYQIISSWIAAGAKPPGDADPRIEGLEVQPARSTLEPGARQQVTVLAHFTDGHTEDVTRWAKFASTNETVVKIDDNGQLSVVGRGEGAVTAWYLSRIVIARVTVPYSNEISTELFHQVPRRNFIDQLVLNKLRSLGVPPSPPATDETFVRRSFLDTTGVLPTSQQVRTFLADDSPEKRDKLIDHLLARNEFVDYWTYKWSDVLLLNGALVGDKALKTYYDWIRANVQSNTSWDKFARQIVLATGSTYENGATNFYTVHHDAQTRTENLCVTFMGLNINCARCHNHPLEKWTNNQYYAMVNLMARVRAKGNDDQRTLYVVRRGDLLQPRYGRPQAPTPLDGQPIPLDATEDRRQHLADWLTSPENPYFSRAIANRVWDNFFGIGLIEPVDDMRVSNPSSNEELLSAVADYLVKHDYDLKVLMRAILQSETYQRSSMPLSENKMEGRFFSRYYPRRMMAEVMLDAISQVTGVPTDFNTILRPGQRRKETKDYPRGTRALQLRDSTVYSQFLKRFGRNERQVTCECERIDDPSMVQVLHLSNGETINEKLRVEGNRIDQMLSAGRTIQQIIDQAYLDALSRFPTEEERYQLSAVLAEVDEPDRRESLEDLYWGLLTSREFLFNH